MRRREFGLLCVFGIIPGVAGCKSIIPWIIQNAPTIEAALIDIQSLFDKVTEWADRYLAAHPSADPKIKAAVDDTDYAIDALARLLGAGTDVAQGDEQAAEQKIVAAWYAMMAILGPLGLSTAEKATRAVMTPDGGLVIPVPVLVAKWKGAKS